jgi:hypothetical protein
LAEFYRFKNGELYSTSYSRSIQEQVQFVLSAAKEGYQKQGLETISAGEAACLVIQSDLLVVIGDTWVAAFEAGTPWHCKDKFLSEEFFGSLPGEKMNFEDFIAAGERLARWKQCRYLEFGTRSNPRHVAMAKLAERHGARIAAITLQKEIM